LSISGRHLLDALSLFLSKLPGDYVSYNVNLADLQRTVLKITLCIFCRKKETN